MPPKAKKQGKRKVRSVAAVEAAKQRREVSNQELREELIVKLTEEGAGDLAAKLIRCKETMQIVCTCCGETRTVETRCKQRWCPVCSVRLSLDRVHRFETAAQRCQWPLMVTLTCKNTKDAQEAAEGIVKAFTKFRRVRFWADRVLGGVASFECTNRGNGWHPHLHVLCDCRWLAENTAEPRRTDSKAVQSHKLRSAQRELSQHWAAALGQTTAVVHARRAFGASLKETLKYNLKPAELAECKEKIAPLLRALKGKRLVIPFGSFYDLGEEWKREDNERRQKAVCDSCKQPASYIPESAVKFLVGRASSRFHATRVG